METSEKLEEGTPASATGGTEAQEHSAREESGESGKKGEESGEEFRELNNEELNKALESFSQNYNLTAQNVKNIIFHIVKNPQTFATLIRKDPDAITGLRMTRSRLRQLERIARKQIPSVRLRPISGPKTFLDVNYDENEEEDTDYNPGTDKTLQQHQTEEEENEEADEQDGDDSSSATDSSTSTDQEEEEEKEEAGKSEKEKPNDETKADGGGLMIVEEEDQRGEKNAEKRAEKEGPQNADVLMTEVDNPIYPLFIKSVVTDENEMDPEIRHQLYDEDNDPEYIFHELDELCEQDEDEYEFRRDRATEIPRWEVKALEQDFEEDEDAPPTALDVPIEPLLSTKPGSRLSQHANQYSNADKSRKNDENTSSGASSSTKAVTAGTQTEEAHQKQQTNISEESCSLLFQESVTFTEQEINALKVQLEKHVQLICQTIVGTSHNKVELLGCRNKAVLMLRELDELAQQRGDKSLLNVPTLEAAIYTAHDIEACREVNLSFKEHNERQPTNEVMWVLSRSGAVRYPELLCPYRFCVHPQMHSAFLPSEQLLLALGLYQLGGVPHSATTRIGVQRRGRYPLIQEYFLPNKTVTQIRNHMKNVRSCPSPGLIHRIIMQAERGSFPVSYRPDLGETAQDGTPIDWPESMQPYWLKWLSELLSESRTQLVVMDGNAKQQQTEGTQTNEDDEAETHNLVEHSTTTNNANNTNIVVQMALMEGAEGGGINRRMLEEQPPATGSTSPAARVTRKRLRSSMTMTEESTTTTEPPAVRVSIKDELFEEEEEEEHFKKRWRKNSLGKRGGEDGNLATTSTAASTGYLTSGPDENSNEQFPQLQADPSTSSSAIVDQKTAENDEGAEGTANANETQMQQKAKSRRQQRVEHGLSALCDQRTRDQTRHALVEAVFEDFKKRMFMHQDKLRSIQQVLVRSDLTVAQCFDQLWARMGSSHPQLFYLFAAIAPESELAPELRFDPSRLACKRALRMMETIQTYMSGTRSAIQMKNTLKFLKEANQHITTEQQLFETLHRQFGIRDEPLWKLLKREWMGAKFDEKVENWEFECVDIDRMVQEESNREDGKPEDFDSLRYESVRILYRHDPTERSRLRVRHGRVTVEMNGRLRSVNIGYPGKEKEGAEKEKAASTSGITATENNSAIDEQPPGSSNSAEAEAQKQPEQDDIASGTVNWTREMDTELLLCYNNSSGNRQKCVNNFLQNATLSKRKELVDAGEVGRRLDSLLEVVNRLRGTGK